MARNEEKAQSMLYRFREAQAAELGLGTRSDRRPRMASACKSLRECERWRGEILREISRKVSKIQDAGLTDYEVRDLNDEINRLMREKRHWENQIIALGGANYRRNVAMLDDDGKEVPGTKGYKYFGRAKDLPGVRELFQSNKKQEEEENQALSYYKKFMNQGPAYYGDLDEMDGSLLEYEREGEEEAWEEACNHVRKTLNLESDASIPKPPGLDIGAETQSRDDAPTTIKSNKRKQDGDVDMDSVMEDSKRPKTASEPGTAVSASNETDTVHLHAQAAAAYIPFLQTEHLLPPQLPTREEMESVILGLRKKALLEEYFDDNQS